MFGAIRRTFVAHVAEHAPASRAASVARGTIRATGRSPVAPADDLATGEYRTFSGADPYIEQAARIIQASLNALGGGHIRLAKGAGVSRQLASLFCDPTRDKSLGWKHLCRLCVTDPELHQELLHRAAGACANRAAPPMNPGREIALGLGSCGEIQTILSKLVAYGITHELLPEGRRAVSLIRRTAMMLERALDVAERSL